MAVYYRYRCEVATFSLPVAAPSISVGELKGLIMEKGRYGGSRTRGEGLRESITISNEQGEEYADDNASVLCDSTVVVRRLPGPPADTIVLWPSPRRPRSRQDSGDSSSNSAPRSAGTEEGEAKANSAVIDATERNSSGRAPMITEHCPTNGDSRFNFGGTPVVAPGPVDESNDDGFLADLHCKICKQVMADAVVTSRCCFSSFCDRCIRAHIVANSKCACGAKASADDLIPSPTLRTTISNVLAARSGSGYPMGSHPVNTMGGNLAAQPAPRNDDGPYG